MNSSDKDLNEAFEELREMKEQRPIQYRSSYQAPFVRDVFDMIEEEHAYRNQIEEEGVANELVFR
jgi:hypothetical protein